MNKRKRKKKSKKVYTKWLELRRKRPVILEEHKERIQMLIKSIWQVNPLFAAAQEKE